jgi:hypothetical protein
VDCLILRSDTEFNFRLKMGRSYHMKIKWFDIFPIINQPVWKRKSDFRSNHLSINNPVSIKPFPQK